LDEQLVRFGENMRHARKAAGLSQIDLSHRASLDRAAVSFLERAERAPDLSTIVRVAGAVGVKPAALLKGVGPADCPARGPRSSTDELAPAARFGVNLRWARERAGISQETLANDAHVDRAAISVFERGKRNPNLRTLLRLARALELPPGVLLRGVQAAAQHPTPRPAQSPARPPTRR
jgi:transcriptional regulator with XRE-family HTH domain